MSDFNSFKSHFSTEISSSLVKYALGTVLKSSRYLFIQSSVGIQYAYCTHCEKTHLSKEKLKHKQKEPAKCPHCRSECKVQAVGVGRKYLEDKAVFVWYEKSKSDKKAVTARIIEVRRDYSGDFKKVQTTYNCSHMYLFMTGQSHYFHRIYGGWEKRSSAHSAFDYYFSGWKNIERHMLPSNIKHAVKGTPFQYCTWEKYIKFKNPTYVSDMVEFFDLAAKYPCVEYLTKAGFQKMIQAKLYKLPTYGAIHWKGKTLQKVLRLSTTELKELRSASFSFDPKHLRFYQKYKKAEKPVTLLEAFVLAEIDDSFYKEYYMKDMLKFTTNENILSYISKQIKQGHFTSAKDALSDWRDYQRQCEKLGMSLKEDKFLFPNNLKEAHRKNTERIKLKEDEKINEMIKQRVSNELKDLKFENKNFIIRPALSSIELFEEGKALTHCVGDYSESYAKGRMIILLIRRKSNPNEPFYTVEAKDDKILQCRGYDNCDMTEEVESFIRTFISKRLKKVVCKRPEIIQGVAI
ncbi:PcfJ domain-containing protein [Paenibacillus alba]|uniref:PcfJ domain-containing protein n=1 Tax=Paenibacillus alba TaxID=1197127 RepID=UPI00156521E0|nr:PcfJ domain-containing protein [Paenibacillus alba]NQX67958.1 PcfJ domain-containing protein [Paenibacillus alba]